MCKFILDDIAQCYFAYQKRLHTSTKALKEANIFVVQRLFFQYFAKCKTTRKEGNHSSVLLSKRDRNLSYSFSPLRRPSVLWSGKYVGKEAYILPFHSAPKYRFRNAAAACPLNCVIACYASSYHGKSIKAAMVQNAKKSSHVVDTNAPQKNML